MSTYVVHPTAEQEKAVKEFLESSNVFYETEANEDELPQHVIDGIQRGLDDVAAGRTMTFDQFKARLASKG